MQLSTAHLDIKLASHEEHGQADGHLAQRAEDLGQLVVSDRPPDHHLRAAKLKCVAHNWSTTRTLAEMGIGVIFQRLHIWNLERISGKVAKNPCSLSFSGLYIIRQTLLFLCKVGRLD